MNTIKNISIFALASVMALAMVTGPVFTTNADARDRYGAIAWSPSTERYGYSHNYGNRGSAESRALNECGVGDCEVAVWFRNACGALAVSSDGAWGYGWAGSSSAARNRALRECRARGQSCRILTSVCSP